MSEPRYRYLKTRTERGVLILMPTPAQLRGDEIAQQLTDDLLAAVEYADAKNAVVNLEHVEYLDSANFRPFLAPRKKLDPGGRVVLCNLSPTVEAIFAATLLVSSRGSSSSLVLFTTEPDVDTAMASIAAGPQSADAAKP